MKFNHLLISIIFLSCSKVVDPYEDFQKTRLVEGPPPINTRSLQNRTGITSAKLDTGIDSLQLYFGSYLKDSTTLFWLYYDNGTYKTTTLTSLEKNSSSGLLLTELSFEVVEYLNMFTVRILYDSNSDEVFYAWIIGSKPVREFQVWELANPIKINHPMPDFQVETIDETILSLHDMKGKHVVINWWATNCAPCITEMPGLNQLKRKYVSNSSIEFIAIADDNRDKWIEFLNARVFTFRQTLSNDKTDSIFGDSYPKHIIIDPNGVVTYYAEGGFEGIHLEIEKALLGQLQ